MSKKRLRQKCKKSNLLVCIYNTKIGFCIPPDPAAIAFATSGIAAAQKQFYLCISNEKKMKRLPLILSLATLTAACSTVKRYYSADNTQKEIPIFLARGAGEDSLRVRMNSSGSKISEAAPSKDGKSPWDLGSNGQKVFASRTRPTYQTQERLCLMVQPFLPKPAAHPG